MTELEQNLNTILEEKQTKIIPENIKKGVTIFGINGNYGENEITRNIFVQETEPEIKDGFWFKNTEEIEIKKTIAKKYFADFIVGNGEWKGVDEYITLPYTGALGWDCTKVGNFIYLFGTDAQPNQAYKYDYINNVITQLPDTPEKSQRCMVSAVGTDVYIIGGGMNSQSVKTIYKFDTLNETYSLCNPRLSQITSLGSSVTVGTDIYIFGGYAGNSPTPQQKAYKYDTLTDTLTSLLDIPYKFAQHRSVEYNGDIFLFGGMYYPKVVYKYNIATNTYTYLGSDYNIPFDFSLGIMEKVGNKVYMFSQSKEGCIFDLDNYTYEMLEPSPYTIMHLTSSLVFKNTNCKILVIGEGQIVSYDFPLEILTDNSLILSTNGSNKSTKLYNDEKLDGNLPIHFEDVGLYTNENGYLLDLERYYGNSKEWVKI